jgi:hypothetical protein
MEKGLVEEILTIEEIRKRFDGEWVLVGDPELSDMQKVLSGKVLSHSKDRDEVYRKGLELRPKHSAVLCFAKIPEDVVIVL